jgi:hypothetical protein
MSNQIMKKNDSLGRREKPTEEAPKRRKTDKKIKFKNQAR